MHILFGEAVMYEIANKLSYDKSVCVCVFVGVMLGLIVSSPLCAMGRRIQSTTRTVRTLQSTVMVHQTVNTSAFTVHCRSNTW